MTKQELFLELQNLESKYKKDVHKLKTEYAILNNLYSIGDVIKSSSKKIQII